MQTFLQLLFAGLALGAIYALIALGFVVVYRSSQVFNFAHGEFLMFGTFLMTTFLAVGLWWWVALVLAMLATGLLGVGVERAILRPMIGRPVFITIIMTILIGLVLRVVVIALWGVNDRGMPTPWRTDGGIRVLDAPMLFNALWALVFAGVMLLGFYLLFQRSKLGVAMRATSTDQEVALGLGIPVGRVFAVSWLIAGILAALAGIFLGMFPRSVNINMGFVALAAFPAVLIGGLESPLGAVIAGLSLGVLQLLTQGYVNPMLGSFGQNFHQVLPYVLMIVFLVVRPYGLFGTREVERV